MYRAETTLFCLPYAGGNPLLFRGWQERLARFAVVHPIALPGRGASVRQAAIGDYRALVQWIARYIQAHAAQHSAARPFRFALFGHSAGARFCFGAALELVAAGLVPQHCFLAANAPPHLGIDKPKRSTFDDAQLLAMVRRSGGAPPEVLANESVMAFMLPTLRSDLRANEQAAQDIGRSVDCPFTLFAWDRDDELKTSSVWAWESYTTRHARRVLLAGGHFAVRTDAGPLLAEMGRDLEGLSRSPGGVSR